jgi:hypothetical protein
MRGSKLVQAGKRFLRQVLGEFSIAGLKREVSDHGIAMAIDPLLYFPFEVAYAPITRSQARQGVV